MKHGDRRGGGKGGGSWTRLVGVDMGRGLLESWRVGELKLALVAVCKLSLRLLMEMRVELEGY